ncbi:DNA primase [Streptomyces viridosporus]|uniref:DNA primase n=1 Tax=Streptomyces viridosporus TaxID=67581 RepID=UPI0009C016AE|nr:DNA primase [Streptomyces viridosporus]
MNRTGLGLAIGAGYLLGRTKKLKAALAVGSLVAGKKLNLSPRMVADLVSQQLRDNPQFKEIGDQLRGDLRGVGKAASGALVERQLGSLADRLHGRTADVRGRLTGVGGQKGAKDSESPEDTEDTEDIEEEDRAPREEPDDEEPAEEKAPPKEAAKKAPAKKAPGKKAAQAKKAPPAKKAAAKKTAAKKTAVSRGTRSRTQKGGGEG